MTVDTEKCIKHELQLQNLMDGFEEQKCLLKTISNDLARLSSYNVQVAEDIKKAVFGNGNPGLIREMTILRERTEERKVIHDKEIKRLEGFIGWVCGILVAAIISALGFFLQQHFVNVIK